MVYPGWKMGKGLEDIKGEVANFGFENCFLSPCGSSLASLFDPRADVTELSSFFLGDKDTREGTFEVGAGLEASGFFDLAPASLYLASLLP